MNKMVIDYEHSTSNKGIDERDIAFLDTQKRLLRIGAVSVWISAN